MSESVTMPTRPTEAALPSIELGQAGRANILERVSSAGPSTGLMFGPST